MSGLQSWSLCSVVFKGRSQSLGKGREAFHFGNLFIKEKILLREKDKLIGRRKIYSSV